MYFFGGGVFFFLFFLYFVVASFYLVHGLVLCLPPPGLSPTLLCFFAYKRILFKLTEFYLKDRHANKPA